MKARFLKIPEKTGDRYSGEIQFSDGLVCRFHWLPLDDRAAFSYRPLEYERLGKPRKKPRPGPSLLAGLPSPDHQAAAMKLLIEYTAHWALLDNP